MSRTAISPESILRELAGLWAEADARHAESGAGVLRACTMTLIAVADEDDDPDALGETIAELMREHPARVILIRLRRSAGSELEERVYSQCWMPFGGRKQVCCERVDITASDASLDDLCSVLAPLAAPDLPSALWWRSARLFDTPQFACVAAVAEKVILDSRTLPDARQTLPRLARLAKAGKLLGDLSWTQLTRWREMLARVFENRAYLARLAEAREVRVWFPGESAPVYAWYMGAWIRNALADAGVKAQMRLAPDPTMSGGTLRLELVGEDFRVALERQAELISLDAFGLSNRMNLPHPSDYMLMSEELGVLRRDPVFERTLSSAAEFAVAPPE